MEKGADLGTRTRRPVLNNLLVSNGDFCLIDFEEIGRTEIAGEAVNLMLDLPTFDATIMTELVSGYLSG